MVCEWNLSTIIRFAQTQEVCATGETGHCFVNGDMVPMNLKKAFPEIYAHLKNIFPVK